MLMNKTTLPYESPTAKELCVKLQALLCTSYEKFTISEVDYDIYQGGDF